MKLWVTGARGFIGRQLVGLALQAGHQVWAPVRPGPVLSDGRAAPLAQPHVFELDFGDATEVASWIERTSPDLIVHLAWYAKPNDYLSAHENVDSLATTLAFAKTALLAGCRNLVGVGTCLEYAPLSAPRTEEDLLEPKSLYARCKHAAHLVLSELFERRGARLTWARLFHMHGPGEHPLRLIQSVAAALRQGRPFSLSPGDQVRDHLDVRDVASALLHLATTDLAGPVNVCSGNPVTLRTVIETVGRVVGRPELLRFGERPYSQGEVMNLAGRADRLLGTGWRPAHTDLEQSIRESIAVDTHRGAAD
jgi:dTDP-6-deoxy-L-talose 4-dehydrogenase (NAD+)